MALSYENSLNMALSYEYGRNMALPKSKCRPI